MWPEQLWRAETLTASESPYKRYQLVSTSDWKGLDGTFTASVNTLSTELGISDIYPELREEDLPEMNVEEYRESKSFNRRYAVSCHNHVDLSQENILKNISIMKSKLMMQCAPYRITNIECKMTPVVKTNLINAYRRVNMYGKKTPFVARFDEYGRRLPDEIKIDTIRGMDIKIINPETYGGDYLSFEAIIPEPKISKGSLIDDSDLPF